MSWVGGGGGVGVRPVWSLSDLSILWQLGLLMDGLKGKRIIFYCLEI